MPKNKKEIEDLIVAFLEEHGEDYFTCAIATYANGEVRNTPIDARNDGLTMYLSSDKGTKLENIKINPPDGNKWLCNPPDERSCRGLPCFSDGYTGTPAQ